MADPVLTQLTTGSATTSAKNVAFSAQANGTLLLLFVLSDDYRTTSGSGRPESTGWTLISDQRHNAGHAGWYKITSGSDTSVDYTIGSATISAYWLGAATDIDGTTPLDTANGQQTTDTGTTYTTPSITPAAGRKLLVGSIGGCRFSPALASMSTWLNSYTEVGDVLGVSGSTYENVGVSWIVVDGGSSTSTGATFTGSAVGRSGIIASFVNGAAVVPPQPLRRRHPARGRASSY